MLPSSGTGSSGATVVSCRVREAAVKYKESSGISIVDGGDAPQELVGEEPLSIIVQGKPYAVVMRTPGEELAHAAGFCLAEGIVDGPDDLHHIDFCKKDASNAVAVALTQARQALVADRLERRSFLSQTSCGICGKEVIQDLLQVVRPFEEDDFCVTPAGVVQCVQSLCARQAMHRTTKASHAASLFDAECRLLSVGEDVGRHNAVDKAVGQLFLMDELPQARIILVSSRVSFEMVQKAARARIPMLLALSHPTALAVELAETLRMTVITVRGNTRLTVYCGGQRLRPE
jgi:FdhD protein